MAKKEKKPIGVAGGVIRGAGSGALLAGVVKVLGVIVGSKK